jgi:hypothetical protein
MLQQAREKLQRANAKLHGSLAMNSGFSEEQREQIRREKLKDEQDTVAKRCEKLLFQKIIALKWF